MAYTPNKQKNPSLRFWIVTLFPETVEPYVSSSIIGRAVANRFVEIYTVNPRTATTDKHKTVDDKPYGGGPGMVMTALPILESVKTIHIKIAKLGGLKTKIIVTSPGGTLFTNHYAQSCIDESLSDIIVICGRYEGVDSRVVAALGAEMISIGDYVLTGGELAALVIVDAITRRINGVLPKTESLEENRVSSSVMYTRPESFLWQGTEYSVPDVMKSGNHKLIEEWKQKNS